MLIRLFKSKFYVQYIAFFILAILLWGDVLFHPQVNFAFSIKDYYTSEWFNSLISANRYLATIVAFLLLFFQSLALNQILENNKLSEKTDLLPAVVYFVFMSSVPPLLSLHPVIVVNFLLILVIKFLLRIYHKQEAYDDVFTAGFLTGIASAIYFPAIFFLLFIWLSFVIYRIFSWREWIISIIGLIVPYLFIGVYFFWIDEFMIWAEDFVSLFCAFHLPELKFRVYTWIILACIGLLIFTAFIKLFPNLNKRKIDIRKKVNVLAAFFLLTIATSFYSGNLCVFHLCLVFIPFSALTASYFSSVKRIFIPEIMFAIIIILILAGKFF